MPNTPGQEAPSSQWSHILSLPMPRPLPRTPTGLSPLPQLTPSDRTGTTLRLLLQDAQKTMEKFSDRLDKLFTNLDQSKHSIHKVERLFEESRERATDETRATVHIAKTELESKLDLLQTKEQAADDASIHSTSIKSLHGTLGALGERLGAHVSAISSRQDSLDKKIDQLIICSEKNSEALTQTNNQLTQLLAALGAVATLTPLFQVLHALPQHQRNPVSQVTQAVEDAHTVSAIYIDSVPKKRPSTTDSEAEGLPDNKRPKISGLTGSGYCEPTSSDEPQREHPLVLPSDATLVPSSSFAPNTPSRIATPAKRTGLRSADLNILLSASPVPVQKNKSCRTSPRNAPDPVYGGVTRNALSSSPSFDENTPVRTMRSTRKMPARRVKLSAEISSAESPANTKTSAGQCGQDQQAVMTGAVTTQVRIGRGADQLTGNEDALVGGNGSNSYSGQTQRGFGGADVRGSSFKALAESVEEVGEGDWSDPHAVFSTDSLHDSESDM